MDRELLFSVTDKDCRWDYFRGSGKGGQKRNKTSSGVRCTHIASGAVGVSDETRSQHRNKRLAFAKMAHSKEFEAWHKIEVARMTGKLREAEMTVTRLMQSGNLVVEGWDSDHWVKIDIEGD